MTDLLASASPDAHGGQWPDVLQLLDKSRGDIDRQFADAPDTRLRLLGVLAGTCNELNRYDLAIPLAEQAWDEARRRHGASDRRTLDAQLLGPRNGMALSLHNEMARWHSERGQFGQALARARAARSAGWTSPKAHPMVHPATRPWPSPNAH